MLTFKTKKRGMKIIIIKGMRACSEKGMSERMITGQILFINIHRLPKKIKT